MTTACRSARPFRWPWRRTRWTVGSWRAADAPVRIDLYQDGPDGPAFVVNITLATPDDGDFVWIPETSGIGFGTFGLRIQVSLVGDDSVVDRSTEPFTVPEDGDVYFVDDASNVGDEYTPAALGSNRNTGKLDTAPKPNPINVLRVYELTGGATLNVDTGVYPLIYTAQLTAKPAVGAASGLGTDRGFLFRGPTDPSRTAEFVTAIPGNANETLVDLDDAPLVQVRFLSNTGGTHAMAE